MSDLNEYYFEEGEKHADNYNEKELIALLESHDINEVYEGLGAIGKRKLQSALPKLQNIALYDEDLGVQEMAIRTIRRIGRRKAFDILDFLRTTEHKDLIERVIKHGYDVDMRNQY